MNADNGAESFAIHVENSQLEKEAAQAAAIIEGIGDKAVEQGRRIDKALDELPKKIQEQEKVVQELTEKYEAQRDAINRIDKEIVEHKELLELDRKEVENLKEAYEQATKSGIGNAAEMKKRLEDAQKGYDAEKEALRQLNMEKTQEAQTMKEVNTERQREKQTLGDIKKEYKETQKEAKDLSKTLSDAVKKHEAELKKIPTIQQQIANSMKTLGKLSAGYLTLGAAKKFIATSIEVRKQIELTKLQFEGLFGEQAGGELLGGLRNMALDSGVYKIGGLAQAAETLNIYGEDLQNIMPLVREFGDVAMGNEQKMNSLAMAIGRLNTQGTLSSLTLRTMLRAGFNPLDEMARTTGKSMEQLNAEMKAGMITTQMVKDALHSATSEGGKYYNMTERLSDSIAGEQGRLEALIKGVYAKWGEEHEDIIKGGYKVAQTLVENYDAIGKTIAVLITTYGAYRTALIATAAVEAAVNAHYVTKIRLLRLAATAQAAFNSVLMMNPYVFAATALTGLVAATIAFSKESDLAGAESKRLKDRLDEQAKSQSDLKDEVKKNTEAINDDTKSESDRQAALNELKRLLPSVFDKYANWIELQKDLAAATAAANDELARQNAIQKGENVNYDRQMLTDLKRYRDLINSRFGDDKNHTVLKMRAELKKKYPDLFQEGSSWRLNGQGTFQTEISAYNDLIKKVAASVEKDGKDLVKETGKMWDGMLPGKSLDKLQQEATQYEKMLEQLKKQNDPAELQKRWNKQNEDSHMQIFGFKLKTMPPAYTPEAQQQMKNESSMVYDWVNGQYITKEELERRLGIIRSHTATIRKNQDKDFLKESKDAYEAGQKELENFIASKRDTNLYPTEAAWQEAIRKKRAEVEQLKKNYENNGGSVKKDTKSGKDAERQRRAQQEANEKIQEENIRWETEEAKRKAEGELLAAQAVIDAMDEGEEKKLAQLDLNHKRELQQLEREAEELYEAKVKHEKSLWDANPANKGKDFYKEHPYDKSTGTYAGIAKLTTEELAEKGLSAKLDSANYKYINDLIAILAESREAMTSYLQQFGTDAQKQLGIAVNYAQRLAEATNEWERLSVKQQMAQDMNRAYGETLEQRINWSTVFGDFGIILKDQLRQSLGDLKEFTKTDKFKGMDVVDQQAIYKVIEETTKKLGTGLKDMNFKKLGKEIDEYEKKLQLLKEATEADLKAQEELAKAHKKQIEAEKKKNKSEIEAAKKEVQTRQEAANVTAQAAQQAQQAVTSASEQVKDSAMKTFNALNGLSNGMQQLSSGSLKGAWEGFTQLDKALNNGKIADSIAKVLGKAFEGKGDLVSLIVGAVLNLLDILKEQGIGGLVGGLIEAILNAVAGIIDNIFSGKFVEQILGGVLNGISNILDAITFGGFGSWLGQGGNEDEMEAIIRQMSETNKNLAEAIDGLKEQISKSDNTNKESVDAYQKSLQAEKEWEENQRRAIDAMASEWTNSGYGFLGLGGKSSFNAHMAENDWYGWQRFTEELAKQGYNKQVTRETIWELTPEQMKILRDFAPAEWAALFNGDGHRNPQDLVNEYIERAGMQEELTSAINEKLTGYDWEGFLNSYKSMLKDLSSTTEDFADHIQELISNALIESFVNDELKGDIKSLYEYIAQAAADGIDKAEEAEIEKRNNEIAQRSLAWRQSMIDAGMIKPTSDTYSQNGSTNSLAGMSQDMGAEMNGRLTSIQLGVFTITDLIQQQATNISVIAAQTENIHAAMEDCVQMQSEAVDHLAKIEKHTSVLPQMQQDIAKIRTSTSALTTKK